MRSFNRGHRTVLDWPMSQEQLDDIGETLLVSPRVGNDHGYSPPSQELYVQQVEELQELAVAVDRGNYVYCMEYLQKYIPEMDTPTLSPILREAFPNMTTPAVMADSVRMDDPLDAWDRILKPWIAKQGIPLRGHTVGVPFVETVTANANAHIRIAAALERAFAVKSAFGICRPVEYYDESFARYETPNHGESPAGHGAFSGAAAKALEVEYNPTTEQIKSATIATKQFCMFRSFARMHIPYSNLLGWQVGYETQI